MINLITWIIRRFRNETLDLTQKYWVQWTQLIFIKMKNKIGDAQENKLVLKEIPFFEHHSSYIILLRI